MYGWAWTKVPIILEIVFWLFSFFWFRSSSSRTQVTTVWSWWPWRYWQCWFVALSSPKLQFLCEYNFGWKTIQEFWMLSCVIMTTLWIESYVIGYEIQQGGFHYEYSWCWSNIVCYTKATQGKSPNFLENLPRNFSNPMNTGSWVCLSNVLIVQHFDSSLFWLTDTTWRQKMHYRLASQ